MAEEDVLPGGKALQVEIDAQNISVSEWAEKHGLDRVTCQRAIKGELKQPSVEFAFDVWQASDGRVDWKLWVAPKAVRDERREQRSAAARARHRQARQAARDTLTGTNDGR